MTVSAPTLAELEALGCSLNAGWLDHYNGMDHTRIALVTADGDLVFEKGGEGYAASLRMAAVMEAHGDVGAVEVSPEMDALAGLADEQSDE